MTDEEPKSAIEIAMEKLRARGDSEPTPLSKEQKAEIAEIRNYTKAKTAEFEIKQQSKMRLVKSEEEFIGLQEELVHEKQRLNEEMENEVRKVREKG